MSQPLSVGVALGGGGAAGLASIGVLQELDEAGIEICCVAGTSAGASVGAAFAAGHLEEFRDTMLSYDPGRLLLGFEPVWPRRGVFTARRVVERIRPFVGERIEELERRFAAVATDIDSGEEIVLNRGDVSDAIRASMAIPGLFTPQRCGRRLLIDGGLVDPIPVSVARRLGARFVIAVTALPLDERGARTGPAPVLPSECDRAAERPSATGKDGHSGRESWMGDETTRQPGIVEIIAKGGRVVETEIALLRLRSEPPDFLVICPTSDIGLFDFSRAEEAVWIGRLTAREMLGELQEALRCAAGSEPSRRAE